MGCSRGMLDHPVLDDVVAQHGTDELDAPRPLESGEAWHVARRKPHADRLQYDELAIIPLGEEALEKGSADEEEGHRRVALHVRVPLQRRLERVEAAVFARELLRTSSSLLTLSTAGLPDSSRPARCCTNVFILCASHWL